VPGATILDLSQSEQDAMLSALRRARYGYLLAVHILLLCAVGKTPTEIADFLFCSRSSVYRTLAAYRAGTLGCECVALGTLQPPLRSAVLSPWLRRSLLALLKKSPQALGWCRTRWSCAVLAIELKTRHRVAVSAQTVRRWVHEVGWVWKRAKLAARDADPERVARLARIRYGFENLGNKAAMFFADELDINLLPKVGYQWMPVGEQVQVMTPGTHEKRYLAGALDICTGRILRCVWFRKQAGLFVDLLKMLDSTYPATHFERLSVVADNAQIHKAAMVEKWLAGHPRFEVLYLPTYCPRANPIERAFGDVHDNCTRNHKRKRLRDLVADVHRHFEVNGPWKYRLSSIYYASEVTAAVEGLAAAEKRLAA